MNGIRRRMFPLFMWAVVLLCGVTLIAGGCALLSISPLILLAGALAWTAGWTKVMCRAYPEAMRMAGRPR